MGKAIGDGIRQAEKEDRNRPFDDLLMNTKARGAIKNRVTGNYDFMKTMPNHERKSILDALIAMEKMNRSYLQ